MLESILNAFKSKDVISRRIKARHKAFWNTPDGEAVRNTVMHSGDPVEKWKDCINWQRKLSNKYNAREFARMQGCRVADLYWKGREVDTIDFDSLPPQYVIRPTIGHSCNMVFLMNNGINLLDKHPCTQRDIKNALSVALSLNPQLEFLIEEFLKSEQEEYRIPDDYKFLAFNGEIASIVLIKRLGRKEGFQDFYDENWNPMDELTVIYPSAGYREPPACLSEMVAQVKKLSREYGIFVRVDFYATDKGPVFGEFTPTPSLGEGFTPYGEELLTYYWDIYCNGMI